MTRWKRWGLGALAYCATLGLLALGGIFATGHIEHRIDRVARGQHQDRRHILAIEKGHPLSRSRFHNTKQVGGDASQPGSTGHQQPGPSPGGHHAGGTSPHPGGAKPEGGPKSSPPPSPAPSPSAPAPRSPEVAAPEPEPSATADKQRLRETAGALGETVNGALEGVGDTGCKLLGCKPQP
jgi:hypothetical protein